METVIVAFEQAKMGRKFRDLIESSGIGNCQLCQSGDQVRRILAHQQVFCVVCSVHLADGPAEWLFEDLPPACSMVMVGAQHQLDTCNSNDIVKLATPMGREEAIATIRLTLQFGKRMEKFVRPSRPKNEKADIDKAKQLLMAKESITEEEAHHRLQKRSMDNGSRLLQTARQVIRELEAG